MKQRTSFLSLLAFIATTAVVSAQPFVQEIRVEANELVFNLANNGLFARSRSDSSLGLAYRTSSGLTPYLNGGGIWFAGRRRSGDTMEKVAFVTFDPATGRSWAAPGMWTTELPRKEDSALYRVYDSREHDPVSGEFLGDPGVSAWPLWEKYSYMYRTVWRPPSMPETFVADPDRRNRDSSGAPVFAVNGRQFATVFHDGQLSLYDTESRPSRPLGLEIEQYTYSEVRDPNVLIIHYRIRNMSNDTLRDCYLAAMVDPHVGDGRNDRTGFSTEAGVAYASSDAPDIEDAGSVMLYLLEGPTVIRNPGFGDDFFVWRGGPSLDTMAFLELGVNAYRTWMPDSSLRRGDDRYDFIATLQGDPTVIEGDAALMLTSGAFHMAPWVTATFAIGITVRPDLQPLNITSSTLASVRELGAMIYRDGDFSGVSEQNVGGGKQIHIRPNPASSRIFVALDPDAGSPVRLQLVSQLGEIIRSYHALESAPDTQPIELDLDGVPAGIYLLLVDTGSKWYVEKVVVR